MKREIPISQIIEHLKEYPVSTKITIDTKSEVTIAGFIIQRKDGSKQLSELEVPKEAIKGE